MRQSEPKNIWSVQIPDSRHLTLEVIIMFIVCRWSGGLGDRRPPLTNILQTQMLRKWIVKKAKNANELKAMELWITSKYYIRTADICKFFNSPVALKNKKIFDPARKSWNDAPASSGPEVHYFYFLTTIIKLTVNWHLDGSLHSWKQTTFVV